MRDLIDSAVFLDRRTPGLVAGDYRSTPVAMTFGLSEAQEAYRKVEAGVAGRVALRPPD